MAKTQILHGDFKKVAAGATQGQVVIPLVRAALWKPTFKSFTIEVQGFEARKPDGVFHPSEHPLLPERLLYHYLTAAPEQWRPEPFDPSSVMAVTQGHFWHKFVETVLLDTGYLKAAEVPVFDAETGAGGSMDGEGGIGQPEAFEFKTMGGNRVMKIEDGPVDEPLVLASFRTLIPEYYAQGQEYLRLSGYTRMRFLLLTLEYPYPMREFLMPYDPHFAMQTRAKYLRVREAAGSGRPPMPCCNLGSKEAKACPARLTCPIGSGVAA